ncbi:MAG: AAA family ATPase [Nitrospinae bacterium]|nr:AAA family ATPase [Nitrospinota bacterium]
MSVGNGKSRKDSGSIKALIVSGFKSIADETRIEIKPLTILSGANSSGKSSIMQPLLLMKQTLEVKFDPGALLLNGSHVKFTTANQLLSIQPECKGNFSIGIEFEHNKSDRTSYLGPWMDFFSYPIPSASTITIHFKKDIPNKVFDVTQMDINVDGDKYKLLQETFSLDELIKNADITKKTKDLMAEQENEFRKLFISIIPKDTSSNRKNILVIRERCFLKLDLNRIKHPYQREYSLSKYPLLSVLPFISENINSYIQSLIHLPGLRGNPEREYPRIAAKGPFFEGTFQEYTASIINHWKNEGDIRFKEISKSLKKIGLAWKVDVKQVDDTRIELKVGRLPQAAVGGAQDMVSIADVGFGVSQTLPLIVALLAANPGQLVYIEQPEIHLHPRAQRALAELIADAVNRGVKVVIETHSLLIIRGIQTLVAKKKVKQDSVILHWFELDKQTGTTKVTPADLDENGAFGDWPEDFDEVELTSESEYLDAQS